MRALVRALTLGFSLCALFVVGCLLSERSVHAQSKHPLPTRTRPATRPRPSKPEAATLAREAIEAREAGDVAGCIQKDRASIALEDNPRVRLHLADCLASNGRVVDALASAREALATAIRNDDPELKRSGSARVNELLAKIAHVRFKLPKDIESLKLRFDGAPVRTSVLRERIAVDPGDHIVEAERADKGERAAFRQELTLAPGEERVVDVLLRPMVLTRGEEECLRAASTYEEKLACIEQKSTLPNVQTIIDTSAYTDTLNVQVVSPSLRVAVASPTGGWNVGGSYVVDVVSAASPDIVSMASPPFKETRHAGSLAAGYKPHAVGVIANGNVSREPDYLSLTGGGALSIDLADKLVTPRAGYSFRRDTIGIRGTPFSQFERHLVVHTIDAGASFVLSPTTVLTIGATLELDRGESSKLYRFVPTFSGADAARVRPGEPVMNVDLLRTSLRLREHLPQERNRIAVAGRLNQRFGSGTLRFEERLYTDSWGIKATTTDVRYLHDLSRNLRVGPHVRFHAQTGATFYRLAYVVDLDPAGQPLDAPVYRTGDRELSPMFTVTGGGTTRIALTAETASPSLAILVSGDVMVSRFLESLFVRQRVAVYGSLGLEAEF